MFAKKGGIKGWFLRGVQPPPSFLQNFVLFLENNE